jgi:hypothetical protein
MATNCAERLERLREERLAELDRRQAQIARASELLNEAQRRLERSAPRWREAARVVARESSAVPGEPGAERIPAP